MSRVLNNIIRTTPVCVLITITGFVLTYHLQVMYDHELDHNFTLCPTAVLFKLQIHRLITSSFVHSSVFHMGMSILTLFSLGTFLEYRFGTLWFCAVIAMSVVIVSATYTILTFLLYILGLKDLIHDHAFGFSKVAFHLLVIECHQSFKPFSVFGLCEVTPKLYPWVSLLVTQLILQHVSFIGHLSGLIVGYLHISGFLDRLIPSVHHLRSLDERSYMKYYQIYIRTSNADELYTNACFQGALDGFARFGSMGNCKKVKSCRRYGSSRSTSSCSNDRSASNTSGGKKKNQQSKKKSSSTSLDSVAVPLIEEDTDLEVNTLCESDHDKAIDEV